MKLSEKQRKIVEHIDGALLVKAGPGSGKTRVLTERIKSILSIKKRGKVLALTFSNMAADEMRSRLETDPLVGDAIARVNASTIHSFCLEIVQSRGYLIGLRADVSLFEKDDDRKAILRSIMSDESRFGRLFTDHEKPDAVLTRYLSSISEQKRLLILPENCNLTFPFPEIYNEFNETLANQNAMDYDDILLYAYRILSENAEVVKLYNSVYRYICVDESQDLNYAQYHVLRALCGTSFQNIMMVGDENQSIYAFNGSSSTYMSESFIQDFSPHIYVLNENFRSAKKIISFANDLTGENEDLSRYVFEGEVILTSCDNELEEADVVYENLEKLMCFGHSDIEKPLKYEDFAIIGRNKYVFSMIEERFKSEQIPYYYKKANIGISFETDHMEVFDLALRLLMNPLDVYHKQRLCNIVTINGFHVAEHLNSDEYINQLLYNSKFMWLTSALQLITTDALLDFDKIVNALRCNEPSGLCDDEKYLLEKDISEWQTHWKNFKSQVPREHRTLVSFRNSISLGKTQVANGNTGVAFLTGHMSKGLEFEVVFIIGLSEGTFPDYRAVNRGGEVLEQEKNNMYVAVTRAKRLCFLSYPEVKLMPWGNYRSQQPSRYIADMLTN